MTRRVLLALSLLSWPSPLIASPRNRNVKWALSAGLWSHYPAVPFTDILDVMSGTGFIGLRLTGYPGVLKTYSMTARKWNARCRSATFTSRRYRLADR